MKGEEDMTSDQAKAFIAAVLGSPKTRASCEGVIGFDCLPEMGDFDSNDRDRLDRCERMLLHVEDCAQVLIATLKDRPVQKEIPGTESEKTGKGRRRKAAGE